MIGSWYFKKAQEGDTFREANQGEYFLNDAIERPAQSLIREAIQNSLDATPDGQVTRIRILLANDARAASAAECSHFNSELWEHLQSEGAELRSVPQQSEVVRYLVIEDFGTEGLTGNPSAPFPEESPNQFFDFFRAEGRTSKDEKERGRWGMGKFVFPACSRGNTFFGLTRRAGDQVDLLLGRCILRSHIVNQTWYEPDGYFGLREPERTGLVLPIGDSEMIARFKQTFNLKRDSECGLSVVIPWIDPEIEFRHLLSAVVTEYAVALLRDSLIVTIECGDDSVEINSTTIVQTAVDYAEQLNDDSLVDFIQFLAEALKNTNNSVQLPAPPKKGAPKWSDDSIPPDIAAALESTLEESKLVSVKVPVWVRRKDKADLSSDYFVHIKPSGSDQSGRAAFVRKDLLIPEPSEKRKISKYLGLVYIPDGPLANMLGLAENPAHTRWQSNSSKFKDRYIHGSSMLRFVEEALHGIRGRLWRDTDEDDPDFFGDVFSISEPDKPGKRPKRKKKPPEPPKIPKRPSRIRINQREDGFVVSPGDQPFSPFRARVTVAYDNGSSNAFRKYDAADFRLDHSPIRLLSENADIQVDSDAANILWITPEEADFQIEVTGFDKNRDIIIKTWSREVDNAETI